MVGGYGGRYDEANCSAWSIRTNNPAYFGILGATSTPDTNADTCAVVVVVAVVGDMGRCCDMDNGTMRQYKLTITMVLDEDSDLLDCLRANDYKSSRVLMSDDAGDQVRDDLLVCGLDKAHYELGQPDTMWELKEGTE